MCQDAPWNRLVILLLVFHCQWVESNDVCTKLTINDTDEGGVLSWTCSISHERQSPMDTCLYQYKKDDGDFLFFTEYNLWYMDHECDLRFPINVLRPGRYTFKVSLHPRDSIGDSNTQTWRSNTLDIPSQNKSSDGLCPIGAVGITLILCLAIVVVIVCVLWWRGCLSDVIARLRMTSQDIEKTNDIVDGGQTQNTNPTSIGSEPANESSRMSHALQDCPNNYSLTTERSSKDDYDIVPYPLQFQNRAEPELVKVKAPTLTSVVSDSVINTIALPQEASEFFLTISPPLKKISSREDYDLPPYPLKFYKRPETEAVQDAISTSIIFESGDRTSGLPEPSEDCLENSSSSERSSRGDYELPYPIPVHENAEPEVVSLKTSPSSSKRSSCGDDEIPPCPIPVRKEREPEAVLMSQDPSGIGLLLLKMARIPAVLTMTSPTSRTKPTAKTLLQTHGGLISEQPRKKNPDTPITNVPALCSFQCQPVKAVPMSGKVKERDGPLTT